MERYLEAGRVGRAHGLDGSFHVTGPRPRLLGLGTPTDLGEIVRRAGTDEKPLVRLAGCETREAAEALHGKPLRVALQHAPALERGRVVGARARGPRGDRRRPRGRDRPPHARAALRRGARGRARRRQRAARADGQRRHPRRSTSPAGASTSTWGSSMQIDVFTLFPHWFDWFRTQRHVANALANGHALEAIDPRATTPLQGGQGRRRPVRRRGGDGAARRRGRGGPARALRQPTRSSCASSGA